MNHKLAMAAVAHLASIGKLDDDAVEDVLDAAEEKIDAKPHPKVQAMIAGLAQKKHSQIKEKSMKEPSVIKDLISTAIKQKKKKCCTKKPCNCASVELKKSQADFESRRP